MITIQNVLGQLQGLEAEIEKIQEFLPELELSYNYLKYARFAHKNEFSSLLLEALTRDYEAECKQFQSDYSVMSECVSAWYEEYQTTKENRAYFKAFNMSLTIQTRAKEFALWAEYHEVYR